ncbi:MAG: glycosyltransferase family 2 protein [Promethearchaeota archaeon]|nr:MAG: glycosyltransferase family 2 protein [Candidatus Lokiarchaeota archaeon]
MKKSRVLIYALIIAAYFVILHMILPNWLNIKQGIYSLFTDWFNNWLLIFPFIGLIALAALIGYFGIHFLASFGKGYRSRSKFEPKISIIFASKDERPLLKRTLDSIIESNYPKDKMEIITVTSGSTDGSTEYCKKYTEKHSDINIKVLADPVNKKGKPAALNYGLKHVKNEICVFYDSGIRIEPNTIHELVSPLQNEEEIVAIGPITIENYKQNKWTRAVLVDYTFTAGGALLSEVKNRLGSSCYLFGRNFCIRTKNLRDYGGFNEESLTEDLYLSTLLNLDGIKVLFTPKAKAYDIAPYKWNVIAKQRQRWIGGFIGDMPPLMKMKKGDKDGASIIISRNLTMLLLAHIDAWFFIAVPFAIIYSIVGFWYLLSWTLSFMVFSLGYIINGIRKYGDGHYLNLLWLPFCAYLHLYELSLQFSMPEEISWEKTPMILEKDQEEIETLAKAPIVH